MIRFFFVFLLLVLGYGSSAVADSMPNTHSTSGELFWGKLNAIYPAEQRLVISDKSIQFTPEASFYDASGNLSMAAELKFNNNPPVEFHVYSSAVDLRLIELHIISASEFDALEQQARKTN